MDVILSILPRIKNFPQANIMISSFHDADDNPSANACENADVASISLTASVVETVQQATLSQFVQAATATTIAGIDGSNNLTTTAFDCSANNCISMSRYYDKNETDEFLTETEFALLSHITTTVGNFDPLVEENIKNRPKFLPVLEARGGSDKDEQGHRRDTLPIANAIDGLKSSSNKIQTAVFQFLEENTGLSTHCVLSNDALKKYLKRVAHGIIVRINPGTLSASSQKKCDDMLRELSGAGITILSHPDVASSLGAKDSLVKIKNLKCGLEDTEVYYTPDSFCYGFRKTIAFQPRVIKQNRGSQGEGIWICKLKDGAYCENYGDSLVSLDTELVLMEAFDNHVEYHTVGDFIEFCINGRVGSSCEWTTTSNGKYFEGGIKAGAMVVDQRFLPRIVEGEVRCLMVGSELVEIVHKKPKEGGLSATLQSGAIYTKYLPSDPKFEKLVKNFKSDIPHIMSSFDMSDQPLPLLWTADYIYGESDEDLFVGEINCSCVGITQQLHHSTIVANVAADAVFLK